jgi:hypothetical protein
MTECLSAILQHSMPWVGYLATLLIWPRNICSAITEAEGEAAVAAPVVG